MKKTALIIGITGQDGSYLAELLLSKDYRVVGLSRNNRLTESSHISHLYNKIEFTLGDLTDAASISSAIKTIQPDEVYNLASQSYPGQSWNLPLETMETNGMGAHRLFEIIRRIKPDCRIYQASSSEMFGDIKQMLQSETTPFNPNNPYGLAKLYAHNIAGIYRAHYKLFISCGIMFNHESPRRGMHFITQKIAYAAACLKLGIKNSTHLNENGEPIVNNGILHLGNLDAKRDWGFAGEYVQAMWLILQQDKPDDFVIGTGQLHSIRDLCHIAFSYVDLNWEDFIYTDPRLTRPAESGYVIADTRKTKEILGWQPSIKFNALIAMMIENHLEKLAS